jgi:hypothetical protein
MVKQVIPRQVDSYLTELQYESLIDSDVQKLFKNADLDHSGFIEFPEFAKFVTDVEVLLVRFIFLSCRFIQRKRILCFYLLFGLLCFFVVDRENMN